MSSSIPSRRQADIRRAEIDTKIVQLEQEIINLKRERNGLQPTQNIPAEVLVHIFAVLQDAYMKGPAEDVPNELLSFTAWVSVATHTCSYWRQVSIDASTLWCTIQLNKTPYAWVAELLRRSRGSTLTVSYRTDDDSDLAGEDPEDFLALWKVLKCFDRIGDLKLSLSAGTESLLCREVASFTHASFRLHSLILVLWSNTLSIKFLNNFSNTLRHLKLLGCPFHQEACSLSLPNLETLEMFYNTDSCACFLELLTFPSKLQKLHLTVVGSPDFEHPAPLATHIGRFWKSTGKTPNSLKFKATSNLDKLTMKVQFVPTDPTQASISTAITLSPLVALMRNQEEIIDHCLCTAFGPVNMHNICTIDADATPLTVAMWKYLARECTGVRSISVGSRLDPLCSVLCDANENCGEGQPSTKTALPFPHLREFHFNRLAAYSTTDTLVEILHHDVLIRHEQRRALDLVQISYEYPFWTADWDDWEVKFAKICHNVVFEQWIPPPSEGEEGEEEDGNEVDFEDDGDDDYQVDEDHDFEDNDEGAWGDDFEGSEEDAWGNDYADPW